MNPALQPILDTIIDGRTKGFPQNHRPLRLEEIGRQGWSVFGEELDLPVAVLKASALEANSAWMREFLHRTNASLCPHGKTSMAPQLFHQQLADGAWGITLATPQQVRIAYEYGVKRILLGNQLMAKGPIAYLQRALDRDPALDFTCLVDSLENVRFLESSAQGQRPFSVLLEVGIPGGRAGARDPEAATEIARAVKASSHLRLRGIECFEGIVASNDPEADRTRVEAWLDVVGQLAVRCASEELFEAEEVLLTAGGSAYFDLVVARLSTVRLPRPSRVLLRSGCYAFHDVGHYARLVARLERRLPESWRVPGGLQPTVELWGRVLSRPEPGLAILDFGKRDAPHDVDLPRPLRWARAGSSSPMPIPDGWSIASLYDQHARLMLPHGAKLQVGDRVGCGISHPCTAFDKWPLLYVVDDDYRIVDAVRTFF